MQSNGIAMPVKPTQSPRPQTPWVVTLPSGDTTHVTRSSFAAACRGHEKIGEVLGYFVYEASWQAKNEGLDIQSSDCTFITIHREAKHMLTRMNVCQKSLIAYIKQLSEWGFITADGYRHTYQVHFQAINAAIQHPPEAMKRKPRGQHAPKPDVKIQSSEKLSQLQSSLAKLQSRLVKLQTETVKIQTRIVNLQIGIVKIQSSESCESASEQGVMGDTEAPRIYENSNSNKEIDSLVVSAHAESNGDASLSLSSSCEERDTQPLEAIPEEAHYNGNAPQGAFQRAEVPEERRASALPRGHTCEAEGIKASTSIEQDTIPGYAPQELTQGQLTQLETNTVSTQETKTKRDSKISPLLLCQPRIIREAIDALRGYALDQEGPMKNERKILKAWCEKHTLEHYHLVIDHLTKGHCSNEKHKWWRLHQRMKTFFNAAKLAELTPEILAELGHIPQPALPPEMQAVIPEPTPFVGWQPVYEVIPRKWG